MDEWPCLYRASPYAKESTHRNTWQGLCRQQQRTASKEQRMARGVHVHALFSCVPWSWWSLHVAKTTCAPRAWGYHIHAVPRDLYVWLQASFQATSRSIPGSPSG